MYHNVTRGPINMYNFTLVFSYKCRCFWDGSADKEVWCQTVQPEFCPWHSTRGEGTGSCQSPSTFTCVQWHMNTSMCPHTQINKNSLKTYLWKHLLNTTKRVFLLLLICFLGYQGLNPGPCTCCANVLSLSYIPSPNKERFAKRWMLVRCLMGIRKSHITQQTQRKGL